ncbi:AB hydrolase-1 domain-containing protein [Forsythia ovata]|uniref:AB hydrolase-1 domain-containing protein n=1 Tax=Forsythia ovata TaxID=205694 RepID=A0ABD1UE66_9LAMI
MEITPDTLRLAWELFFYRSNCRSNLVYQRKFAAIIHEIADQIGRKSHSQPSTVKTAEQLGRKTYFYPPSIQNDRLRLALEEQRKQQISHFREQTRIVYESLLTMTATGRFVNKILSFIVFTLLDILDFLLCYIYKILDYLIEAESKPCYCSSAKEAITSSGKILVSEHGESKILRLTSTKLQLEEISDTLYTRPSLLSEVSKSSSDEL